MNPTRSIASLALVAAFATCSPASAASEPPAELRAKVERFVVDHFRLAPPDTAEVLSAWTAEPPEQWRFQVRVTRGGKAETAVYAVTADFKVFALSRLFAFRDIRAENRDKVALDGAPVRGAANAPVAIVAFCDLQCPDCANAMSKLKTVLPAYEGRARLVFKNYPLNHIHPWAEAAAIGARCAYEQKPEAFWALHDHFFEKQGEVNARNVREVVATVGAKAGADCAKLLACFDAKATLPVVQRDVYEANKLGVRGTPTFLVDGRFVFSETLTEEQFKALIDEALAAQPARP